MLLAATLAVAGGGTWFFWHDLLPGTDKTTASTLAADAESLRLAIKDDDEDEIRKWLNWFISRADIERAMGANPQIDPITENDVGTVFGRYGTLKITGTTVEGVSFDRTTRWVYRRGYWRLQSP